MTRHRPPVGKRRPPRTAPDRRVWGGRRAPSCWRRMCASRCGCCSRSPLGRRCPGGPSLSPYPLSRCYCCSRSRLWEAAVQVFCGCASPHLPHPHTHHMSCRSVHGQHFASHIVSAKEINVHQVLCWILAACMRADRLHCGREDVEDHDLRHANISC